MALVESALTYGRTVSIGVLRRECRLRRGRDAGPGWNAGRPLEYRRHRSGCGRRRLELGRLRRGSGGRGRGLWCSRGRPRILRRQAMRDELVIAGRTGSWRRVGRQTAGPMRPVVGDVAWKLAARPERRSKSEQEQYRDEPSYSHVHRPDRHLYRDALNISADRP